MTNLEFRAWRERCGYSSWVAVAHDLRLGLRTVKSYASGERPVPNSIARLCELVELGQKTPTYRGSPHRSG